MQYRSMPWNVVFGKCSELEKQQSIITNVKRVKGSDLGFMAFRKAKTADSFLL